MPDADQDPRWRDKLKGVHVRAKHAAHPIPLRQLKANRVREEVFLQGGRLFHFQCVAVSRNAFAHLLAQEETGREGRDGQRKFAC